MTPLSRRPGFAAPLACALRLAAVPLGVLALAAVTPAVAQQPAAVQTYAIAAGPLGAALTRFAAEAGVLLSFDPAWTNGRQTPGLRGRYGVGEGLTALLAGSGLSARQDGAGWSLVRSSPAPGAAAGDSALPAVTVRSAAPAETASGPVDGYLARRASGVLKTDTPIVETARSISIVTADQMRDRKVASVEDAVAYLAGVQVGTSGDDPRFDTVRVRGFDLVTDADYRDGLRQANTGWLSYFRTEPYALERLELVKGPDSVLYGQISPGGLINRVSKRPTRETAREVELQLGSHRHRQAQFDLRGEVAPDSDWHYRLVGLARKSNTGTVGVNDDSLYLAPALTWSPSARTSVTLLAHWQDYRTAGSPRPFQLPSGVLTEFWSGDVDFDGLKQRQAAFGWEARHQIDDIWTLRQNLRVARARTDNQYVDGVLDADGDTINRDAYGVYEKMRNLAVDTALEARFATGALRHQLSLGLDYHRVRGDVHYFNGAAPSISMTAPNYHQPIARPDAALVEQGVHGAQTGLYVNDQITLDRWRFSLGLRRDQARQVQTDLAADTRQAQRDRATSGSIGALYLSDSGLAPYVSYATSFLPQFGRNVLGDAYKPTTGRQLEVGLKYQPSGGRSLHTISIFDLVQRNVRTRDPADPLNTVQTGEIRSRGIELESTANLPGAVQVVASYTYQDVKNTRSNDVNAGMRPVNTARHLAALWVHKELRVASGLGMDFGLGARWTGSNFADATNTQRNPGYAIVDARFGLDLQPWLPGAALGLNLSNLADKRYVMCEDGYCYRGRGRSVVASLNYRW